MNHDKIDPSEVIFVVRFEFVLTALVKRGHKTADMSVEDLELARDEVRAAIDHNLDVRDFIEMGLDAWEIVRNL